MTLGGQFRTSVRSVDGPRDRGTEGPRDRGTDGLMDRRTDGPSKVKKSESLVGRFAFLTNHLHCTTAYDDELRTAVYPSNMAWIGAKLRQHMFRTICNFSFFDAENKNCWRKNSMIF